MRTLLLTSTLLILSTHAVAAPTDATVARYEKLRSRSPGGLAAEFRLARWCEDRELNDRASKHWLRALCIDTQNEVALKALELEPLLSSETDPASKKQQLQAIDRLATFDTPPANFVLAWYALNSGNPELRDRSFLRLREKPEKDYVPFWLATLALPVEVAAQSQALGKRVMNHYTIEQELPNGSVARSTFTASQGLRPQQFVGLAIGKSLPFFVPADTFEGGCGQLITRTPAHWNPNISQVDTKWGANGAFVAEVQRANSQAGQARARVRGQVAQLNQMIELQNQRVTALLRTATGEEFGANPRKWWQWWGEQVSSEPTN